MKTLAIHGHPTRGREVIEILEMLGGENKADLNGNSLYIYYINCNNRIDLSSKLQDKFVTFHLEEFLEKYPYKIGDKVKTVRINDFIGRITNVQWDDNEKQIIYTVEWDDVNKSTLTYFVTGLQPYKKDENMNQENETNPQEINYKINLNNPCLDGYNKIELILPDNWKFKQKDGKMFGIRKQYPKTYEECSKILHTSCSKISIPGYKEYQVALFQELLICRDAYWKIAGEEMGLSGSWAPDFKDNSDKYFICYVKDEVWKSNIRDCNKILVFPTEEMRDTFYENFKDLIKKCKEFL